MGIKIKVARTVCRDARNSYENTSKPYFTRLEVKITEFELLNSEFSDQDLTPPPTLREESQTDAMRIAASVRNNIGGSAHE